MSRLAARKPLLAAAHQMKIPFTNLHQQYVDCQAEIDQAISDTIQSSSFITGLDVTRFEQEMSKYVGAEDCASTGSGTTALLCSLKAAGVGPGDEVITTPHTFVATTEAICTVGATPVFVDIDPDTHLIDLEKLVARVGPHTRAILFVDIYGQCPDLTRLREICDRYNLVMIQDAAHSLGGTWQQSPIGSQADYTCFSFNPVKNLGAMGDAGCVTGSQANMDRVRIFRDHGRTDRYEFRELGYNARIDNMQANIVLAKLPRLANWIADKNLICDRYDQELGSVVKTVRRQPGAGHARYVYVIQTDQRQALKQHLETQGIGTNIHYATTTHTQPAFRDWYTECAVAERTVHEILSLPCWYSMPQSQIDHVIQSVKGFFR
jgi:dTDP-4-amino-4,6-dideoxygalactose transaminase